MAQRESLILSHLPSSCLNKCGRCFPQCHWVGCERAPSVRIPGAHVPSPSTQAFCSLPDEALAYKSSSHTYAAFYAAATRQETNLEEADDKLGRDSTVPAGFARVSWPRGLMGLLLIAAVKWQNVGWKGGWHFLLLFFVFALDIFVVGKITIGGRMEGLIVSLRLLTIDLPPTTTITDKNKQQQQTTSSSSSNNNNKTYIQNWKQKTNQKQQQQQRQKQQQKQKQKTEPINL